jgi:adenylate kinase
MILDGFPRTVDQAKKFDEMMERDGQNIDKVFSFFATELSVVERIAGRRIHAPSGRSYHGKFNPP